MKKRDEFFLTVCLVVLTVALTIVGVKVLDYYDRYNTQKYIQQENAVITEEVEEYYNNKLVPKLTIT